MFLPRRGSVPRLAGIDTNARVFFANYIFRAAETFALSPVSLVTRERRNFVVLALSQANKKAAREDGLLDQKKVTAWEVSQVSSLEWFLQDVLPRPWA